MARVDRWRVGDGNHPVTGWLYGDAAEIVVIEPPGGALPDELLGGRVVTAVICLQGSPERVGAAIDLGDQLRADVAAPAGDRELWTGEHPDWVPQVLLFDGVVVQAGGTVLRTIATPGVTPGAVCLYDGDGNVFTGAALAERGSAGAEAVRERLLRLPPETVVHPATGDRFTIADAAGWLGAGD